MYSRGQSEVVGSILLVALVVVVVSTVGALSFSMMYDRNDPVSAVIEVEKMNDTTLTLQHGGGDSVAVTDLEVVARNTSKATSETESYAFADGESMGDGDDRFEAGERWRTTHTFSRCDQVQVLLVDQSTGTVLLDSVQWAGNDENCRRAENP